MANISAIKLPNGTTYTIKDTISGYTTNTGTITKVQTTAGAHTTVNVSSGAVSFNVPTKTSHLTNDSGFITNAGVTGVKGNAESSYRTGQVNLTAANIGAILSNSNGNTQYLLRPLQLNGLRDVTLDAKINTLRANRLAFLPADQIIIEKTTDGGSTWTDAGVADSTKVGLFSETRADVSIPLLNGVKNINCGLRITITGMKYNVPSGTTETSKYNYWNSNYIVSTERYNQLKEMYFWVSANSDTISVKVERATGAASTTWNTIFDNSSYGMTGWSGNDYIRFTPDVFGGSTAQTGNYWNYRLTFFTRGPGGSTTLSGTNTSSRQTISEIRGYGDTWWTAGNEYAANDKIYTHDYLKNVTFPAKVTASGGFSGNLTGNVTGNVSGSAGSVAWSGVTSKPTATGFKVTGITASTTATKTTLGTAFTIPNVTNVGSASTWAFEDVACDDITSWSAGSASTWAFTGVTAATGTINATVSGEAEDTLTISLATTTVQSKSSGGNGTAPSLGYTAKTASHVKSGGNGSAPTLGTAFTVPNVTGNTSATVSITDPGHTHTLS